MIAYEETVRLPRFLSPVRALSHILGTLLAAGLLYWSDFRGKNLGMDSWSNIIPGVFIALDFFPVLKIVNGALFPEVLIQIDETALILRRGLVQSKISLESVVEISSASASQVKKTTVLKLLYQNSDFLFLDRKHSSNVELLLSGGDNQVRGKCQTCRVSEDPPLPGGTLPPRGGVSNGPCRK